MSKQLSVVSGKDYGQGRDALLPQNQRRISKVLSPEMLNLFEKLRAKFYKDNSSFPL